MMFYCFGDQEDKWLVVFCDEVNLPQPDAYNTARVITFMRQMVEQQGYWQSDGTWVRMERINFVGASNPPTDAGRVPLPLRLLRHMPVVLVRGPSFCVHHCLPRSHLLLLLLLPAASFPLALVRWTSRRGNP